MWPPKEFEEWCLKKSTNPKSTIKTSNLVVALGSTRDGEGFKLLAKKIVSDRSEWPYNITLDGPFHEHSIVDFSAGEDGYFDPEKTFPDETCHFSSLTINSLDITKSLVIKGAMIDRAKLNPGGPGEITFKNCCIRKLIVDRGAVANIRLNNCWVYKLKIDERCLQTMSVEASRIYTVECPPPDAANPFVGQVSFSNTYFPTSKKTEPLFQGEQQYRNLRAHFEILNNSPAAGLMRAKELASLREDEKGAPWLFSWIYYGATNYGLCPGRPFWFALAFYLVTVGFIFGSDGGGKLNHPADSPGWESNLNKCQRSFILPLQSMLNPVGAFRQNQILAPNTGWGKLLLVSYGFVSDGLLLFFILGLRKHFKLS